MISTVININELFDAAFGKLGARNYEFAIRLTSLPSPHKYKVIYGDSMIFNKPGKVLLSTSFPNATWEYAIISVNNQSIYASVKMLEWAGYVFAVILFFLSGHLFRLRLQNVAARNNLKRSEAQLQTIINTTLTGVAIINKEGLILFSNNSSESIFGYAKEEIIGKHFSVDLFTGGY